jgi:hypothetical protein
MTRDALLALAQAYAQHTGLSLTTVSKRAASNNLMLPRLAAGRSATSRVMDRAFAWFAANWPAGHPWPAGVPHPCRPCGGAPVISAPANCDERSPSPGRG